VQLDGSSIGPYGIPIRIGAADFNGDGKSDLIAFFGGGEFVTFLNEGRFRFSPISFRPQVADVPSGGPTILGLAFSDISTAMASLTCSCS
jgi:hypothetical protein